MSRIYATSNDKVCSRIGTACACFCFLRCFFCSRQPPSDARITPTIMRRPRGRKCVRIGPRLRRDMRTDPISPHLYRDRKAVRNNHRRPRRADSIRTASTAETEFLFPVSACI